MVTVQTLLQENLDDVLNSHSFPLYQIDALKKFSVCRTSKLGGHAQYCPAGHLNGIWYNSCKHRSCPQCQAIEREKWLQNTKRYLLDCPHHHIVFTLPEEFNIYWRYNRSLMADFLFTAVNETLKQFSKDSRYLDATPGIMMVLHTWGRNLCLHPHIHCVLSHGGLGKDGEWVEPKKKSLFPQKPVMQVYRGKFRELLLKALTEGKLLLPPSEDGCKAKTLLNKLGRKEWVVHFCDRYEHAKGVANYLSRYIRGGSFNNNQLRMRGNEKIEFRFQSHQTKRKEKLVLSIKHFIIRMAQHIALPRKQSVRYGGLYASGNREKLNQARESLGQNPVSEREEVEWKGFLAKHIEVPVCAECGLPMFESEISNNKCA